MIHETKSGKYSKKILVLGALGQIGSVLTQRLCKLHGKSNVIASDIRKNRNSNADCNFIILDATDYLAVKEAVINFSIDTVYLMAAMLSAEVEKKPEIGWNVNMKPLLVMLDLAKKGIIKQIFWPSSIAVFGPSTPKINTPQLTIMDPTTIYGIAKLAGERWCEYYKIKFGVDVRSLRYPGIISWQSPPGGGTTDYAVHIFKKLIDKGTYTCFLKSKTKLPMMYIDDAVRATTEIMSAEADKLTVNSSYNLAAITFDPNQLFQSIKKFLPKSKINYEPDFRQAIADSWPKTIDDSQANKDWGWKSNYDLNMICEEMLENIKI